MQTTNQSPAPIALSSDDESTWPVQVVEELERRVSVLRDHRIEEERILDDFSRKHADFDTNPLTLIYTDSVALVDEAIRDTMVIGYHATRLTEDEMEAIQRDGMTLTSEAFAETRVRARIASGDVDEDVGKLLMTQCLADSGPSGKSGSRKGMIWCCFSKDCLAEELGIANLFSFWGGEVLYVPFMKDPDVAPVLKRIGTACIVEVEMHPSAIETYGPVGQRLLRAFLHRRGIDTGDDAGWEGNTKLPIPNRQIRRIIPRASEDFLALTRCDRWSISVT